MSSGTELLWPGAALLVLLGVAASLCVRCSRPGRRGPGGVMERSMGGAPQRPLVGQAWPGPLVDTAPARKDKLLQFSPSLEDLGQERSSAKGGQDRGARPFRVRTAPRPLPSPADDDDNSYENVLICKQKTTEPGAQQEDTGGLCGEHSPLPAVKTGPTSGPCPSVPLEDEESEDYQNSASIRQWRESRRAMGQVQREASPGLARSPDEEEEDGEPDYVNREVAVSEA
uniref:Linker for activation of T cells family member 2 n=1 Tax=Callithrix jacchus TaxID=9483 RepID=A0A2R8M7I5_CALJA